MAAIKEKRCYTAQEIQEILNISRPSVYNLIKRGEFHSVFVGGKHLISKKSFDAWLNGVEIEPEVCASEKDNENKQIKGAGFQHLQEQQRMVSSGGEDISTINTGAKQEEMNYQEMQERFLQNMMKTYMMIESVGHMK